MPLYVDGSALYPVTTRLGAAYLVLLHWHDAVVRLSDRLLLVPGLCCKIITGFRTTESGGNPVLGGWPRGMTGAVRSGPKGKKAVRGMRYGHAYGHLLLSGIAHYKLLRRVCVTTSV